MICMLNRSVFELQDKLGRTLMASEASDTNYFLKRHLQSLPTFSDVSLSLITTYFQAVEKYVNLKLLTVILKWLFACLMWTKS